MLQVRQLEKIIENRSVLYIEQLDIGAGEVVAVMGPAHSGKSLLVRILAGTLPPSGGSVLLEGKDIYQLPGVRARIGTLFEDDLLYERMSAQQNLNFYAQLHGLPRGRVAEVLIQVGMSDQARKPVSKLSLETQRRLAFARLLLRRPAVYVLDQPFLRCDQATAGLFVRLIAQIAQEGAAVLMTTEDLTLPGKCCTRVIELQNGKLNPVQEANQASVAPLVPEKYIPFRVSARKDDRIMLFDPGDILYATSQDGKTIVHTAKEEAVANLSLQELESRLVGRGFFKAHRAYLVNLQHIKAMIQYTRNSYTLQLNDAQETMIPLSKQCEKELQELLGY